MNYIITDHLQVEESRLASMSADELVAYATEAKDLLTKEEAQAFIDGAKNAIEERAKAEKVEKATKRTHVRSK